MLRGSEKQLSEVHVIPTDAIVADRCTQFSQVVLMSLTMKARGCGAGDYSFSLVQGTSGPSSWKVSSDAFLVSTRYTHCRKPSLQMLPIILLSTDVSKTYGVICGDLLEGLSKSLDAHVQHQRITRHARLHACIHSTRASGHMQCLSYG